MVSWTACCFILTGEFVDAMVSMDEDLMPLDGNPHPLLGVNPPQTSHNSEEDF